MAHTYLVVAARQIIEIVQVPQHDGGAVVPAAAASGLRAAVLAGDRHGSTLRAWEGFV